MIRITVELISAVHPSRSKLLGVMHIANTGTGTAARSDYTCGLVDRTGRTYQTGQVLGHPRKAVSMWRLVCAALKAVGQDWGVRHPDGHMLGQGVKSPVEL